ncbi:Transferase domain-containing protein, partial [Cephalotus follicularis]
DHKMVAKGDFTVMVSRKEVVAVVLPLQEHWLPLSNLDLLLPPLDVGVFFCYKQHNTMSFGSMISTLKKAMAETLLSYYAFAGEVVPNSVGEPELLCNNRGVDFFEAFPPLELSKLNLYNPDDTPPRKLVPNKKHEKNPPPATELKCGGIVVACPPPHRIADAHSTNMFLPPPAERAQSKPITALPPPPRSLLSPSRRPMSNDESLDELYVPISSMPTPDNGTSGDHLISRIYYVKADQLNQLQSLATAQGCKRTKLEAFSAFLWKLVAQSATRDHTGRHVSPPPIVVDGRSRISEGDPPPETLMASYFGNVLSPPPGAKKIDDLIKKPLPPPANEVHEFIQNAVTPPPFCGLIDWVEEHRPPPPATKIYCPGSEDGPPPPVSSGQRFPVSEIDFGWGKPFFGSYHIPWGPPPGYVMTMPSPVGNDDWVVYMHLHETQLEFVESQAKHVFRPITNDYLPPPN